MNDLPQLYELAIIALILGGIFLAWRAGQANPEGTGRIAKRIGGLDGRIKHVEAQLGQAATKTDLAKLEGEIDALREQMAGDRALAERTFASVQRIETFLIEKGLGGR